MGNALQVFLNSLASGQTNPVASYLQLRENRRQNERADWAQNRQSTLDELAKANYQQAFGERKRQFNELLPSRNVNAAAHYGGAQAAQTQANTAQQRFERAPADEATRHGNRVSEAVVRNPNFDPTAVMQTYDPASGQLDYAKLAKAQAGATGRYAGRQGAAAAAREKQRAAYRPDAQNAGLIRSLEVKAFDYENQANKFQAQVAIEKAKGNEVGVQETQDNVNRYLQAAAHVRAKVAELRGGAAAQSAPAANPQQDELDSFLDEMGLPKQ